MWEKCLVRRTLSSSIPFEDGKKIASDIAPSQNRIVKAPMTAPEKALYDKETPPLYRKLVRKMRNGKLVWDMAKYRQLTLLTTWVDFLHVHASIKASDMGAAVKMAEDKTLFFACQQIIMEAENIPNDLDPNNPKDHERALTYVLRGSPRLRALLPIIAEQVFSAQRVRKMLLGNWWNAR